MFEIATRALETEENGARVSWGQKVDKEKVIGHYDVSLSPGAGVHTNRRRGIATR
jgi:hypothetical protein